MRFFLQIILVITVIGIIWNGNIAHAYSVTTHEYLTNEVLNFYDAHFASSSIIAPFRAYILQGSRNEDDAPRWMNHFYDPSHNRGLTYDPAIDPLLNLGTWHTSKEWAEHPEYQATWLYKSTRALASLINFSGTNNPYDLSQETNFTWQRAKEYWTRGEKEKAMIILGHVLHLLEDASVPDHTRNDPHPGDSPYENWTTQFSLTHPDNTLSLRLTNKTPYIFSTLGSFFDALAIYSNNNFYSKDTIGIQSGFQIPHSDEYTVKDNFKYILQRDADGEFFLFKKPIRAGDIVVNKKDIIFDSPDIMRGYWERLSTKAIQYSAGIVNLFLEEVTQHEKEQQPSQSFFGSLLSSVQNTVTDIVINNISSPTSITTLPPRHEDLEVVLQYKNTLPQENKEIVQVSSKFDQDIARAERQLQILTREVLALQHTQEISHTPSATQASFQPPIIFSSSGGGGSVTYSGGGSSGNIVLEESGITTTTISSTSTTTSTPDIISPAVILDFAVTTTTTSTITLTWTASGDDGMIGTSTTYLLRYATTTITTSTWDSATPVDIFTPHEASTTEQFIVTGLFPATEYFFAIRATDDVLNIGDISNIVSTITLTLPPYPIISSFIISSQGLNISFSWESASGTIYELMHTTNGAGTLVYSGNATSTMWSAPNIAEYEFSLRAFDNENISSPIVIRRVVIENTNSPETLVYINADDLGPDGWYGSILGETFTVTSESILSSIGVKPYVWNVFCNSGISMGLWRVTSSTGDVSAGVELLATSTNVSEVPYWSGETFFSFFPLPHLTPSSTYLWGVYTYPGCVAFALRGTSYDSDLGKTWKIIGDMTNAEGFATFQGFTTYGGMQSMGIVDFYENITGETSVPVVVHATQLSAEDGHTIFEEEIITTSSIIFQGIPVSPKNNAVKIQVEVRHFGAVFTNAKDDSFFESEFVTSGATAVVHASGFTNDSYVWRIRAVDSAGIASPWQWFGSTGRNFIISMPKIFTQEIFVTQNTINNSVGASFGNIIAQTFIPETAGNLLQIDVMMYTGYASCNTGVKMGLWKLNSMYGDPRDGGIFLGNATDIVVPQANSATHFSFSFDAIPIQNTYYYMWGVYATDGECSWGTFGRNTGDGVNGKAWSGIGDVVNDVNITTLTNILFYPAPLSSYIVDFYEVIYGMSS